MDFVEKKANSVEEAVELALAELNLTKDQVDVEIVAEKKLFSKAVVRVIPKQTVGTKVKSFLTELLTLMKLDADVVVEETDDTVTATVNGEGSRVIIGYRGDVLDAVQYLTLLVANGDDGYKRVVVDAENYREKRAATLTSLALKLADKADRTGRKIELEPMNPYERRIIHAALQDSDKAKTESQGEEPNRHVVILPKNAKKRRKNDDRKPREKKERTVSGGYGEVETVDESKIIRMSGYDPYAPCDDEETKFNFAKTGFKKMRSFGNKKR